jgi:hypothetical protein
LFQCLGWIGASLQIADEDVTHLQRPQCRQRRCIVAPVEDGFYQIQTRRSSS